MKDRGMHDGEPEPDAINLPPLPTVTPVFIACAWRTPHTEKRSREPCGKKENPFGFRNINNYPYLQEETWGKTGTSVYTELYMLGVRWAAYKQDEIALSFTPARLMKWSTGCSERSSLSNWVMGCFLILAHINYLHSVYLQSCTFVGRERRSF